MPISNEETVDIRTQIFSLVNDKDKTKNFVKECIEEYNNYYIAHRACDNFRYPQNFHIFYNFKIDKFTIYPKFGETIFIAHLKLTSTLLKTWRMNEYDTYFKDLHNNLHNYLVDRVKLYKDDLLKINNVDVKSEVPIPIDICRIHYFGIDYEVNGFVLPEAVRTRTMLTYLDKFYVSRLYVMSSEQLVKQRYGNFYCSEYFQKFRYEYYSDIMYKFTNSKPFIEQVMNNDGMSTNTIITILKDIRIDLGYDEFYKYLDKFNDLDKESICRILNLN